MHLVTTKYRNVNTSNIILEGSDTYMYLTNVGIWGNAGMYVRGRDATNELRSHSTNPALSFILGGDWQ